MMMSRPRPEEETKPEAAPAAKKKSSAQAVEDLERRLQMLDVAPKAPDTVSTDVDEEEDSALGFATKKEQQQRATVKGGKNALLARIMAAQERAKKAQQQHDAPAVQAPAPAAPDLLSAPVEEAPPPAFDAVELPPPKQDAPPPFEAVQDSVMEQVAVVTPKEPVPTSPVPMMPSAPPFEDLLDSSQGPPPPFEAAAVAPNPLEGITQVVPPPPAETAGDELWGGMSEEERKEMMDEQRKIMAEIEREKAANAAAIAAAQAENFEARSGVPATSAAVEPERMVHLGDNQTVALHGQERTRAAIADGTAILVQCMNCSNWMQVTESATLMYCPVCSVVSPVLKQDAVMTKEEALQMTRDMKLAQQLQNEEYKQAEQGTSNENSSANKEGGEESWWDSITSVFASSAKSPERAVAVTTNRAPPPGTRKKVVKKSSPGMTTGGLEGEEGEGLLTKARVAERQPLFNCVVDSVSNAASTLVGTSQTLHEDREGQINGVDASSLLTVTSVGRETQYEALAGDEK